MEKTSANPLSKSERWGQFRLQVIGSLLISPPEKGELAKRLRELTKTLWIHPFTGLPIRYGSSTIERWFYQAKQQEPNPIEALTTSVRCDKGQFRTVSEAVRKALATQYAGHSGWSRQLHYDNLLSTDELTALPSYSTLRRYMQANGMVRKFRRRGPRSPGALKAEKRLQTREVRSYEVEHANALWHLDYHHGSLKVINSRGEWVTPLLLAIMDDRSRLICHLQWYYSESAENLVHGLCQAFQKRSLPRSLMSDNGGAMVSGEFTRGLNQLSVLHHTTLPYSAYQNGKQETFWANVEGRLLAMLENEPQLTLRNLNRYSQAWVEMGYHRKIHQELKQSPLDCYLQQVDVGRPPPGSDTLRAAFRVQVSRRQRRSDGTISIKGKRFEIPDAYHGLDRITVNYAHWDLASVAMIDPTTQQPLSSLYPVNKSANANGLRRLRTASEPTRVTPPSSGLAPYLKKMVAEYGATGLPQSYLPKDELEPVNE